MALGYWPGCYRTHAGLGLLAMQLQSTGGTGLAATSPILAWRYWLLQATGLPWGTGLAAAAHIGYWQCYRPQVGLGYWPGCYRLQVGLRVTGLAATGPRFAWVNWPGCCSQQGVLAWLLQTANWHGDTGLGAAGSRLA